MFLGIPYLFCHPLKQPCRPVLEVRPLKQRACNGHHCLNLALNHAVLLRRLRSGEVPLNTFVRAVGGEQWTPWRWTLHGCQCEALGGCGRSPLQLPGLAWWHPLLSLAPTWIRRYHPLGARSSIACLESLVSWGRTNHRGWARAAVVRGIGLGKGRNASFASWPHKCHTAV